MKKLFKGLGLFLMAYGVILAAFWFTVPSELWAY